MRDEGCGIMHKIWRPDGHRCMSFTLSWGCFTTRSSWVLSLSNWPSHNTDWHYLASLNNKWVPIKIWCLQGLWSSLCCVYCSDWIVLLAIQLIIILIILRVTRQLELRPFLSSWTRRVYGLILMISNIMLAGQELLLLFTPNLCTSHGPLLQWNIRL